MRFLWSEVEAAFNGIADQAAEDARAGVDRSAGRARGVSAQRGQIFRTGRTGCGRSGSATRWAGGRSGRASARAVKRAQALDEELRRVRLGPLYRPNATLRELYEAYLDQYDVAPSTVAFLKDNMKPALDDLRRRADRRAARRQDRGLAQERCRRASATASLRSLRQVLAAGVRWKWIEDNPAALVKNPEPKPGEIDPFESWAEIDAIDAELDEVGGALVQFLCGTGVRPEEAFGGEWRDVDLERAHVPRAARVREGPAEGLRQDRRLDAGGPAPRAHGARRSKQMPGKRRGILFPAPEGGRIDINNWRNRSWTPASRPRASSTAASTTCGTRTRPGRWRLGSTSSRWLAGWARA